MNKILFFLIFPFYLYSAELWYGNGCCAVSSLSSSVSWESKGTHYNTGTQFSGTTSEVDSWYYANRNVCLGLGLSAVSKSTGTTGYYRVNEYTCTGSPCSSGQELVGAECLESCSEGQVRTDTGECVQEEDNSQCNDGYTLTTGYTTLLPSRCNSCITNQTCLDAYTLRQMTDSEQQLCCIKFDNSDDEVEAPETSDNNSTPLDLNPTNEILEDIRDDANLNADQLQQEEQETIARLEEVKEILSGLNSDNNENSTAGISNQNSNTDRQLNNDNSIANQAHQDQLINQGKYDDLILNLRTVTPAIQTMTANANANSQREIDTANVNAEQSNAQNQEHSDRNHEDLEGIKDAIENLGGGEDFENEFNTAVEGLGQLDNMIQDSRETIMESFNDMVVDYTGLSPVFTATGDCVETFEVFGKTIELDFNFFSTAKFAFDIIFTLLLALMTFKVYFFIFVSLTNKA